MSKEQKQVDVSIGDGVVVLKREGQTEPVIAGILGMDRDSDGQIETIWLDRVVHKIGERSFVDWKVSGAVSSILKRDVPEATSQPVH